LVCPEQTESVAPLSEAVGASSTQSECISAEEASAETELAAQVAALRSNIAEQEKVLQERYLRLYADFENYRKRIQKEQAEQIRYANAPLLTDILPVLDNLERALAHSQETHDFNKMIEGVTLIYQQQCTQLEKYGVQPIESIGQPFDPLFHQSIGQIEVDRETQDNCVVSETQKGYKIHERVLRPTLVVVGRFTKKLAATCENNTTELPETME